ncbi:hypothetical protein BSE24067_05323 [Burkholderia seminalis]|nr:hypothetical protein BSE24067_05323 [Burkholderia seminalis]
MNPNRLVSNEDVYHELHTLRSCKRVCDACDGLGFWVTADGHFFTVPELGPDKVCPLFALNDILKQVDDWSAGAGAAAGTGTD